MAWHIFALGHAEPLKGGLPVKEAASLMNSRASRCFKDGGTACYRDQIRNSSKLPLSTFCLLSNAYNAGCKQQAWATGPGREAGTYVVNLLELLLKQTLPDRD